MRIWAPRSLCRFCSSGRLPSGLVPIRLCCWRRHRKLSESDHAKDNGPKVKVDKTPDLVMSLVVNTDYRDPTIVEQDQHSIRGSCPPKMESTANSRREAAVSNLAATFLRAGASFAAKNDQPIEKRVAAHSDSHASKIFRSSQKKASPKQANSCGGRRQIRQPTVQTRNERLQEGSSTGTHVAAHNSKRALLRQAHSSPVSKARTRGGKARGGKIVRISSRDTEACDERPSSKHNGRLGKSTANGGRKTVVPMARKEPSLPSESVRRSQRISQRPIIAYSK